MSKDMVRVGRMEMEVRSSKGSLSNESKRHRVFHSVCGHFTRFALSASKSSLIHNGQKLISLALRYEASMSPHLAMRYTTVLWYLYLLASS